MNDRLWAGLVLIYLFMFIATWSINKYLILNNIFKIRKMINDPRVLEQNFKRRRAPISEPQLQIIAYRIKNGEEPTHKNIPNYKSSKSIRKIINRMNYKKILKPWKFKIERIEKKFEKEKDQFEKNLDFLWGITLNYELKHIRA